MHWSSTKHGPNRFVLIETKIKRGVLRTFLSFNRAKMVHDLRKKYEEDLQGSIKEKNMRKNASKNMVYWITIPCGFANMLNF